MKNLVLIVAMFALASGCRPKSKPTPPSGTTAAIASPSEPAEQVAERTPDAGAASADAALAGPPCIDDQSCQDYLRCEAGHCVVPPAVEGREVPGMPTATFSLGEETLATIKLEIADDRQERTRGLMFRRKMHPDFGMLFIFDNDEERSFWMKNTLIPLDMVHINSAGEVVGVVERAEPMTLSPRQTGKPARYVLELVAGRAAELGIASGTKMTLDGLPAEQSPNE